MGRRAIVPIAAVVAIGFVCITAYLYQGQFPLPSIEEVPTNGAIPQHAVESSKPQTVAPAPASTSQAPVERSDIAVPPAESMSVPTFDVVLIQPNGEGVLAGRAGAKWKVEVESGSTKIAETTADEQGEWSIVLDRKLAAGDHQLSLRTLSPDGTRVLTSQQIVQVAVGNDKETVASLTQPEVPVSRPATVEHEPDSASASLRSAPQFQTATETVPTPAPKMTADGAPTVSDMPGPNSDSAVPGKPRPVAAAGPQQQNLVTANPDSPPVQAPQVAEVVPQGQNSIPPEATAGTDMPIRAPAQVPRESTSAPTPSPAKAGIVFKTVDYQDTGEATGKIKLAGTSDPGATIQLHFDDKPLARVTADRLGQWSAESDMKLSEGRHSFSAEEVDEAGYAPSVQTTVSFERKPQAVTRGEATDAPAAAPTAPVPTAAGIGETGTSLAPSQQTAGVEAATDAAGSRSMVQQKKAPPRIYTIRRGDTLWDLAERYLGGGWRYTSIFRGNRKVIKNPDEILPQQKVTLPKH